MLERGVPVRHTTIHGWVKRYAPGSGDNVKAVPESVIMDYCLVETVVLVEKQRKYLYSAMSPDGTTLDFILYDAADRQAAERFLRSRLQGGGSGDTAAADTISIA